RSVCSLASSSLFLSRSVCSLASCSLIPSRSLCSLASSTVFLVSSVSSIFLSLRCSIRMRITLARHSSVERVTGPATGAGASR
ncbi:hypothetical protein B484DRAFT_409672, partial [Ochromonadaceae sp. CCMP2298]